MGLPSQQARSQGAVTGPRETIKEEALRLRLEGILALLEHLSGLDKLGFCAGIAAALADGDLLLQLGDGIRDAAAKWAEDVLGLLCGLFLWDG